MGSPDPRDGDVAGRQIAAFLRGEEPAPSPPAPVPSPPPSAPRVAASCVPTAVQVVPFSRDVLRSHRKRAVRAKTESIKRMPKFRLELLRAHAEADLAAAGDFFSPTTRGDCANVARPCPHVSCKHHLYLDVSRTTGAIKLNFPDLEVWEMTESCAADVADRGGETLESVAALTNVTRERVRQVEERALARLAPEQRAILREFVDHRSEAVSLSEQMEAAGGGGGGAGVEDPIDWREVREQDELLETARTASIAGHLMTTFGLPLRTALARASEYAEDFPGEMPAGVAIEMPEEERVARPPMSTPPERIVANPVVPSAPPEGGSRYIGLEQLIEGGGYIDCPVGDDADSRAERADAFADGLVAVSRPRATTKRVLQPRNATPAREPEKDRTMAFVEEVYEALSKAGNATAEELAAKMGNDRLRVSNALRNLLGQKRVDRHGGHKGAHWELGSGKSVHEPSQTPLAKRLREKRASGPKSIADVAKKAAKKQAKRAKANGNGHANGHAAAPAPPTGSAMGDAVAMLKAALTEDFNRKLAALDVLAK